MSKDTSSVTISTDGACSGNPGPGGWAARLRFADGSIHELGGGATETTNNRMELQAAIEGLKYAGSTDRIVLITDSEYLRKGITEWIHNWKLRGWKTASKKPVLNQDLWQQLDAVTSDDVRWEYTKGHAGDPDNERCDKIAVAYSQGLKPELIQRD
ncbi:MAG: ribonuclease HI [Candidatus Latescibacterota bacterium]|nr:ribonuclease HI [Candidatus Latescibacterota bacterium]